MYLSVDAYCELMYGREFRASEKTIKSKRNTVSEMCRNGTLKAIKCGRRWLIEIGETSESK